MLTCKKVLRFLNLTDKDSNLSLTNLSVYLFLIEMLVSPFEWTNMIGLVAVLLNYSYERNNDRQSITEKLRAQAEIQDRRLQTVNAAVGSLTEEVNLYKASHEEIAKQAEETKRLLSTNAIGTVFGNRR